MFPIKHYRWPGDDPKYAEQVRSLLEQFRDLRPRTRRNRKPHAKGYRCLREHACRRHNAGMRQRSLPGRAWDAQDRFAADAADAALRRPPGNGHLQLLGPPHGSRLGATCTASPLLRPRASAARPSRSVPATPTGQCGVTPPAGRRRAERQQHAWTSRWRVAAVVVQPGPHGGPGAYCGHMVAEGPPRRSQGSSRPVRTLPTSECQINTPRQGVPGLGFIVCRWLRAMLARQAACACRGIKLARKEPRDLTSPCYVARGPPGGGTPRSVSVARRRERA